MSTVKRRLLAVATVAALALASVSPASAADIVPLSYSLDCVGSGGSHLYDPPNPINAHSYTSGEPTACDLKYLFFTYKVSGVEFTGGAGWTTSNQLVNFNNSATQVNGAHRLCKSDFSLCSSWGFTSE
jgi:hypothetical protein